MWSTIIRLSIFTLTGHLNCFQVSTANVGCKRFHIFFYYLGLDLQIHNLTKIFNTLKMYRQIALEEVVLIPVHRSICLFRHTLIDCNILILVLFALLDKNYTLFQFVFLWSLNRSYGFQMFRSHLYFFCVLFIFFAYLPVGFFVVVVFNEPGFLSHLLHTLVFHSVLITF